MTGQLSTVRLNILSDPLRPRGRPQRTTVSQVAREVENGFSDGCFFVERQTELAREDVSGAARNDRESRLRARQTLNRFVDGAVTAGDDHVRTTITSSARGDLSRIAGTSCQTHVDFDAERLELCGEFLNRPPA